MSIETRRVMTQAGAAIYTPLLEVARSVLDRENSIGAFYRSAVWDAAAFIYTETCKMSSPAAVEALIRLGAMDAFEDFLCTNLSTWEALWLCDLPDETKGEGWLLDIADRLDERVSCVQPSPDRRSTLLQTRKHLFEHVLAACPLEAFETAHMLCGGQAAPFPAAYAAVGKLVDEALESLPHASPSSIIFAIRAICRSLDRGNRGK